MKPSPQAIELMKKISTYNWDDGLKPLQEIINNPETDLGIALKIYWMGEPDFFAKTYASRSEVPSYNLANFDLLKSIEQKVEQGFYQNNTMDVNQIPEGLSLDQIETYNANNHKMPIPKNMYSTQI